LSGGWQLRNDFSFFFFFFSFLFFLNKRLIFMTYNGWVMIAVSVGAGLGYLIFGGHTMAVKDTACH